MLGRVAGSFGVRGQLRIRPYTERADGLLSSPELLLGGALAWQPITIERGKVHGGQLIVQVRGITTREQAVALGGREIAVWRDALPAEADDEVYLIDLIGLQVRLLRGGTIGRIDGFIDVGGTPVMRVVASIDPQRGAGTRAKEWLIPFREPHLVEVDLEAGAVQVDWPEAATEQR